MVDVIFNGVVDCKFLNWVQVKIIFDNSDYYLDFEFIELMVICWLYWNGDFEYLVNDWLVWFKDIVDFFIDLGIGCEFFLIIFQGWVVVIFNGKLIDWWEVIEMVVGVVKYK